MLDRTRKLRIYAREGVRHAWLVDPAMRMIEVLTLEAPGADGSPPRRWVIVDTFGADQVARIEPFDAVELEVGLLWEDGTATGQP